MGRIVAGVVLLACAFACSFARADSLYSGHGPRPGPDILYETPATDTAPQLTNNAAWHAKPILVSGATAYRDGEFLYQDFLYEDHGANSGMRDPNDPRSNAGTSSDSFSAPNGTYTYPTDAAKYGNNAADLVELRVQPMATETAFRITLNTLLDPTLVGMTIAIGDSPVPVAVPHGANATANAATFLTVHGTTADLVDATGKTVGTTAPTVTIDTTRRQFDIRVPHSSWDPGASTVKLSAGVGLWDVANDRYLIPQGSADATHPGGAGSLPAPTAFFNVAFRAAEPVAFTPGSPDTLANPSWWRDRAQGEALKTGDFGKFTANVDFAKLAARTNDDSGVPTTGPMDRIMASHFETKQGIDYSQFCGTPTACLGVYRGQLQPYAIYIPKKPTPPGGWPLTLLLHSLGASYNQFLGSHNQSELGDRGPGSIVISAEGRGTDGWYYDYAGADTFEMWADAAQRFPLNAGHTTISGYSMGGYATYKFATQFPDLFAKAQPVVGPPGLGIWAPPADPVPGGQASNTNNMLPSVRNIPFLIWDGTVDELVPVASAVAQAQKFDDLGYRYIFDLFNTGDHLALAVNDEYGPAAKFLGDPAVDRDPAHVTYVVNPTMDFAHVRTKADHAYWTSALTVRKSDATFGTIDAVSHGFGFGDPKPNDTQTTEGALTGGQAPALPYSERSKDWGPVPTQPVADVLDLDLTNISHAAINLARARLTCGATVNVKTDGPATVTFPGCSRSVKVADAGTTTSSGSPARCASRRSVRITVRMPRGARVRSLAVTVGGRKVKAHRARDGRIRVSLRGAKKGVYTVRVRLTYTAHGRTATKSTTRHYRTCVRGAKKKKS